MFVLCAGGGPLLPRHKPDMGSASSTLADRFQSAYEALPEDVREMVESLCAKDDQRLLKPHPAAPSPYPPVPVGVVVRLSNDLASRALKVVPRLQRKHYEMIPKQLSEVDFFLSFFSHLTAITDAHCPGSFPSPKTIAPEDGDEVAASWKGERTEAEIAAEADAMTTMWKSLPDEKKALVGALAVKDSDVLLQPNPKAPPAFPRLPLGMDNFIDIAAATAALSLVPGLQYKHYMMVPKKLDERSFWVNFFSHVTAIQLNA